jgi:uncharacterized protein
MKCAVIPSEARNLALVFLGRSAQRRARFLAPLGMTPHGFWVPVSRYARATALEIAARARRSRHARRMTIDMENIATQTDRPALAESIEPQRLPGFHIMAKPVGPICNLNCRYCFYLEKENLYPATASWAMPDDVLESYIRQYIEAQEAPTINFAWQGGEPTLLGVDYFRRIVELEKRYADGKRIENAFQTNGTLLDDTWADFLAANRFLVGLSIDGPAELHDCYRVNKGEQPTFGAVLRGLEYLKKHGVEFNTLSVVHRRNSRHPLEVYRFLKDLGSTYMQFIPIVERMAKAPDPHGLVLIGPRYEAEAEVSEWSVEPSQFGKFLCEIFDEWVRRDVARYFVQVFDVALES